jgi:hypothetical protein
MKTVLAKMVPLLTDTQKQQHIDVHSDLSTQLVNNLQSKITTGDETFLAVYKNKFCLKRDKGFRILKTSKNL